MRLNRRERFLVAVLIILLLWTGFYKFYIEPEAGALLWKIDEMETLEEQIRIKGSTPKNGDSRLEEKMADIKKEQVYFPDMSPEKMDSKLQNMAESAGIQLISLDLGETRDMETEGFASTSISLEFLCTDQNNAASFVDKIKQEGDAMWINNFELEKQGNAFKCKMEVAYCHEQE